MIHNEENFQHFQKDLKEKEYKMLLEEFQEEINYYFKNFVDNSYSISWQYYEEIRMATSKIIIAEVTMNNIIMYKEFSKIKFPEDIL